MFWFTLAATKNGGSLSTHIINASKQTGSCLLYPPPSSTLLYPSIRIFSPYQHIQACLALNVMFSTEKLLHCVIPLIRIKETGYDQFFLFLDSIYRGGYARGARLPVHPRHTPRPTATRWRPAIRLHGATSGDTRERQSTCTVWGICHCVYVRFQQGDWKPWKCLQLT